MPIPQVFDRPLHEQEIKELTHGEMWAITGIINAEDKFFYCREDAEEQLESFKGSYAFGSRYKEAVVERRLSQKQEYDFYPRKDYDNRLLLLRDGMYRAEKIGEEIWVLNPPLDIKRREGIGFVIWNHE